MDFALVCRRLPTVRRPGILNRTRHTSRQTISPLELQEHPAEAIRPSQTLRIPLRKPHSVGHADFHSMSYPLLTGIPFFSVSSASRCSTRDWTSRRESLVSAPRCVCPSAACFNRASTELSSFLDMLPDSPQRRLNRCPEFAVVGCSFDAFKEGLRHSDVCQNVVEKGHIDFTGVFLLLLW